MTASLAMALIPRGIAYLLAASLVLLSAWGLSRLLHRASAAARHRLWTAALGTVLALPLLSALLPSWSIAGLDLSALVPTTTAPAVASSTAVDRGARDERSDSRPASGPVPNPGDAPAISTRPPVPTAATPSSIVPPSTVPASIVPASTSPAWIWMGGIWMAGALLVLGRLAIAALAAARLARRATPITDGALLEETAILAARLGLRRPVALLTSPQITMPMVWSSIRDAVLLPVDALAWKADKRRAVLLHELAHLRRRDCQISLLARVVAALHWCNPLAWIAVRRLQAERELACDDLVLRAGTASSDYAQHLLDIARSRLASRTPSWAAMAMARPSELEGRLLAILDPDQERSPGAGPRGAASLVVLALLALPLASLQLLPGLEAQGSEGREAGEEGEESASPEPEPETALRTEIGLAPDLVPGLDLYAQVDIRVDAQADTQADTQAAPEAKPTIYNDDRAADDPAADDPAADDRDAELEARTVQAMVQALADPDAQIRVRVARTLGQLEDPTAVEPLAGVLRQDPSSQARQQAAWALGMIESPRAVDALAEALARDAAGVRQQAAWALGMIEDPRAVAPLSALLGTESEPEVRAKAAWALGMIESADAVDALVSALVSDSSPDVRAKAAWALGMVEDRSALEGLLEAIGDDSADVREKALWAIGQLASGPTASTARPASQPLDRSIARSPRSPDSQ